MFIKDRSLSLVTTFSAVKLAVAGKRDTNRGQEREMRVRLLSVFSLSEELTGREIDHWSMTAQYDPMLSCSMLSVE